MIPTQEELDTLKILAKEAIKLCEQAEYFKHRADQAENNLERCLKDIVSKTARYKRREAVLYNGFKFFVIEAVGNYDYKNSKIDIHYRLSKPTPSGGFSSRRYGLPYCPKEDELQSFKK